MVPTTINHRTICIVCIMVVCTQQNSTHAMLTKSDHITFEIIEKSIRKHDLEKTSEYIKSTFLSTIDCYNLIKIIAVEGNSKDHIELIKEIYTYVGTLFIKKLKNKNHIKNCDPYKEGERIIAKYRKNDLEKSDIAYALLHNHPLIFIFLMQTNNQKFLKHCGCDLVQSAVMLGRFEILKILLDYKVSINCTVGIDENSIWHTAATVETPDSLKIFDLLKNYYETTEEKKLDLSIKNNHKESPLMSACCSPCRYLRPEIVKYLLENKSDPNIQDEHNNSPLHRAILWNCPKTISLLLQYGANPNAQNKNKETPLHLACKTLNEEAAYILIKHKNILINAADAHGDTSLHILLQKKNLNEKDRIKRKNIVMCLLNAQAQWDIANNQGIAPLHYSTEVPSLFQKKYLKRMLLHKKSIDWSLERGDTGDTLLHQLITKKVYTIKDMQETTNSIQFLLKNKASVTHENKNKETPLSLTKNLLEKNKSEELEEYYLSLNNMISKKIIFK